MSTHFRSSRIQIRLGISQLLVTLAFIAGCFLVSFYLGFRSGNAVGFEEAVQGFKTHQTRIPVVVANEDKQLDAEILDKVYAKLKEPAAELGEKIAKQDQVGKGEGATAGGKAEEKPELAIGQPAPLAEQGLPGDDLLPPESEKSDDSAKLPEDTAAAESALAQLRAGTAQSSGVKGVTVLKPEAAVQQSAQVKPAGEPLLAAIDRSSKNSEEETKPIIPATKAPPVATVSAVQLSAATRSNPPVAEVRPPINQRSNVPTGWYAQVAAPKDLKDASQLVSRLRASGFPAVVEQATVRGEAYFRVLVGPKGDKPTADGLVGQLEGQRYLQGRPFIKFVK